MLEIVHNIRTVTINQALSYHVAYMFNEVWLWLLCRAGKLLNILQNILISLPFIMYKHNTESNDKLKMLHLWERVFWRLSMNGVATVFT